MFTLIFLGSRIASAQDSENLKVTGCSPGKIFAGNTAHILISGRNFHTGESLTVNVGKITAIAVDVIDDNLLCATLQVPSDANGNNLAITVASASNSATFVSDTEILPPPGEGDASLVRTLVCELADFSKQLLISRGSELIQKMNQAKGKKEARELNSQLQKLTGEVCFCLHQIADELGGIIVPPIGESASGLAELQSFKLNSVRCAGAVCKLAQGLSSVGDRVAGTWNEGASLKSINTAKLAQSIPIELPSGRNAIVVDLGRGPIPLPLTGHLAWKITQINGAIATVVPEEINLQSARILDNEVVVESILISAAPGGQGTLDLTSGALDITYRFAISPALPVLTRSIIAPPPASVLQVRMKGVVAPIGTIRTILASPKSSFSHEGSPYYVIQYGSASFSSTFPILAGVDTFFCLQDGLNCPNGGPQRFLVEFPSNNKAPVPEGEGESRAESEKNGDFVLQAGVRQVEFKITVDAPEGSTVVVLNPEVFRMDPAGTLKNQKGFGGEPTNSKIVTFTSEPNDANARYQRGSTIQFRVPVEVHRQGCQPTRTNFFILISFE